MDLFAELFRLFSLHYPLTWYDINNKWLYFWQLHIMVRKTWGGDVTIQSYNLLAFQETMFLAIMVR